MRTTLAIDDDVLAEVEAIAEAHSTSLGKMATNLLRRALAADCPTRERNGLTVLWPGPRSPVVTSAAVLRLLDNES